ncbi:glycosyl hydrolase 2 galactose-binding domain-containing protein [Halorussus caseinilyticus]|uniref:glycosyl hydrolase 2 galactose-binding domain-containing protein n=1 Tax=Halorussus caseinilyticus TaxID=3034025 RepID=UPI0023E78055|nr:hydrolase [Halorussus sp. DT72]
MSLTDWTGAAVEPPAGDGPPSPDEWHPVEVPGRPERFADADAVAYRTEFADPREGDERATLELRGLFAHARIWLNGELLGEHDAYFVPARYELDPQADNVLVVECRSPETFGGVYATDRVPDERAVPGIWWAADLETHPETFIDALTLTPRRTDDGAVIDAELEVEAGESLSDRISLSVRPQGFRGGGVMERARIEADAGERVSVTKTLELRDPAYWWPAGHGPQHRYAVRARLGDSEAVVKTGLSEIRRADEGDGLLVNGQRVRARGFSLLPTGDPTWDVERAANANANFVRASGHVPPAEFYETAAEAGLLVWQDLPISGGDEYDADRATELVGTLSSSVERHPCVAAFGVRSDPTNHLAGVGPSRFARYKVRWRAWRAGYDAAADRELAEAFPDDAVVFPVSGAPGIDPDATHVYPGWDFGEASDTEWVLDKYDCGGAVGAFGAGSLTAADGHDAAGFDADAHDAYVSVGDDEDDVEASQAYQTRVLKHVTETLRRRGTGVLAADALRDADAGAGMGVLSADGSEKSGYEAMAASLEPVQVVLDGYPSAGGTRALTVLNDTPESVSGTVSWTAGDETGETDVEVEAYGREPAGDLTVPDDAEAVETSFGRADGAVRNIYRL